MYTQKSEGEKSKNSKCKFIARTSEKKSELWYKKLQLPV